MRRSLSACCALAVAACEGSSATEPARPNCTDVGVPAISVTTVDSRSYEPVRVPGSAVAREGAYADTVRGIPPAYYLAYNRAGTYSVSVDVPGYRPWRLEGVVVTRGACNVQTIPLAARLIPN